MSSWYDVMVAEDEHHSMRVGRMSPGDWSIEVNHMLRSARPGQIVNVLAKIMALDAQRVSSVVVAVPARSARDVAFGAWRDMVDEPEKYGSDLEADWLALDTELSAGSGHWRLEGHWLQKEADLEEAATNAQQTWRDAFAHVARLAAEKGEREWFRRDIKRMVLRQRKAVLTIQAAVRGHLVRNQVEHMNCCMCLAHRVCPLTTDVGMMCTECAEQGPHEDITGPVADPWNWFRADFTDHRKRRCLPCDACDSAPATDQAEDLCLCDECLDKMSSGPVCVLCHGGGATDQFGVLYCAICLDDKQSCLECGNLFLKGTGPGMGFCDRECARAGS